MCGKLSPPGIYLLRWGGPGKELAGWRVQPDCVMAGREKTDVNPSSVQICIPPEEGTEGATLVWWPLETRSPVSETSQAAFPQQHSDTSVCMPCASGETMQCTLSVIQKEPCYLSWDELPRNTNIHQRPLNKQKDQCYTRGAGKWLTVLRLQSQICLHWMRVRRGQHDTCTVQNQTAPTLAGWCSTCFFTKPVAWLHTKGWSTYKDRGFY